MGFSGLLVVLVDRLLVVLVDRLLVVDRSLLD